MYWLLMEVAALLVVVESRRRQGWRLLLRHRRNREPFVSGRGNKRPAGREEGGKGRGKWGVDRCLQAP